jgi:hypothetical protein
MTKFLNLVSTLLLMQAFPCASSTIITSLDDNKTCIEEGWRWRAGLDFVYEGKEYKAQPLHAQLSETEREIGLKLKEEENNLITFGFSILLENSEGKTEWDKTTFFPYKDEGRQLIFRSGETKKVISASLLKSITEQYKVSPPYASIYSPELKNVIEGLQGKATHLLSSYESSKSESQEAPGNLEFDFFNDSQEETNIADQIKDIQHDIQKLLEIEDTRKLHSDFLGARNESLKIFFQKEIQTKIKPEIVKLVRDELEAPDPSAQNFKAAYLHSEQELLYYLRKESEKIINQIASLIASSFLPVTTASTTPVYKSIKAVVLHIHSTRDICRRCALSITRLLEDDDSFVNELKKRLTSNNHAPEVAVLCSSRREMPDRYRRSIHGHDGKYLSKPHIERLDYQKVFIQSFLPYSDSANLLSSIEVPLPKKFYSKK